MSQLKNKKLKKSGMWPLPLKKLTFTA
jgi:hypothetical protein